MNRTRLCKDCKETIKWKKRHLRCKECYILYIESKNELKDLLRLDDDEEQVKIKKLIAREGYMIVSFD